MLRVVHLQILKYYASFKRPLPIPNENLLFMIHGLNPYKWLYIHAQNMWIHKRSESMHVSMYLLVRKCAWEGRKEGVGTVFIKKKKTRRASKNDSYPSLKT